MNIALCWLLLGVRCISNHFSISLLVSLVVTPRKTWNLNRKRAYSCLRFVWTLQYHISLQCVLPISSWTVLMFRSLRLFTSTIRDRKPRVFELSNSDNWPSVGVELTQALFCRRIWDGKSMSWNAFCECISESMHFAVHVGKHVILHIKKRVFNPIFCTIPETRRVWIPLLNTKQRVASYWFFVVRQIRGTGIIVQLSEKRSLGQQVCQLITGSHIFDDNRLVQIDSF